MRKNDYLVEFSTHLLLVKTIASTKEETLLHYKQQ